MVPVKLNYESIVDRRGSNAQSLLKMTRDEIQETAPGPVLLRRC